MGGRSRRKGKVGERELAAEFRDQGFTARRGQQFQGGPGSPDVVVEELPWLHVECKRSERLKLYEAMNQSRCDAGAEQLPRVAYRANHRGWLAIMELGDFLRCHFDREGRAEWRGKPRVQIQSALSSGLALPLRGIEYAWHTWTSTQGLCLVL
jgi:Holliday junction resolvase